MFPIFKRRRPRKDTEVNKEFFIDHLAALEKQFSLHFKDVDISDLIGLEAYLPLTTSLWTNDF
jgi:hypothetical protein